MTRPEPKPLTAFAITLCAYGPWVFILAIAIGAFKWI